MMPLADHTVVNSMKNHFFKLV